MKLFASVCWIRRRAQQTTALNEKRQGIFGGTESKLIATTRVRTEHNCVPIDDSMRGDRLLLGYQVSGAEIEMEISDVLRKLN